MHCVFKLSRWYAQQDLTYFTMKPYSLTIGRFYNLTRKYLLGHFFGFYLTLQNPSNIYEKVET